MFDLDSIASLHPVLQAALATAFTWGMTTLGAAVVFLRKDLGQRLLDGMLGFAAGVMIAASYWSLLAPAIEMDRAHGGNGWGPAAGGFLMGAFSLRLIDYFLPHLHLGKPIDQAEGVPVTWNRSTLLVLAITLHNIPEGMAVGVAFGAAATGYHSATLIGAIMLAIGIGIQNFPEGLAVSVPLRREGMTRKRAFMIGQLSGMVELFAGVFGAALVLYVQPLLPWALAFAAGAMIFVVVEEVIPESQNGAHNGTATMGTILGFVVMMVLDVALG